MEAVLGLGGKADHLGAVGEQRAQVADRRRRDPDGWQEAGSMEAGQDAGGDLVGHDLGAGGWSR